jgi:hypothetical protein
MNDWRDLSAAWRAQAVVQAPSHDLIAREAARASRQARAWLWCWWLVQASVVAAVVMAGATWFGDGPAALRWIVNALALVALIVWWMSRARMQALLSRPTLSALDHLRAERARAAAVPWFVAVDFVVYALLAMLFGWMTWASVGEHTWLGVDWGSRDPTGLVAIWGLLAVATGYDILRLTRSRTRSRELDALIGALERDATV